LIGLGLSDRQIEAVLFFKTKGEVTTAEYSNKFGISERTARRDLSELVKMQLAENKGDTNQSKYIFSLTVR